MNEIQRVLTEKLAALEEHWKQVEQDFLQRLSASESKLTGYEQAFQKVLNDAAISYTGNLRSFQKEFEKAISDKLKSFREDYELMLEARTQEHEERMSGLKRTLKNLNDKLDMLFKQLETLE